jgi:SAM-dependent methyltransferase
MYAAIDAVERIVPAVDEVIRPGVLTVVDCGCYGWRHAAHCQRVGASLIGVDQAEPPGRPPGAAFAAINKGVVELPGGSADVVIASHVLEHVVAPVDFMWELMRITRRGGLIWIEAPSELSAQPVASDDAEDHSFESFWDDPTHIRPWTPGALYRLALSCHCMPLAISRCDAGGIPSVRMMGRKPYFADAVQQPRYVSLRGVPPGVVNAWRHVWGAPSFDAMPWRE